MERTTLQKTSNNYDDFYRGEEFDLKIYDRGDWVSIHTFLKERSQS